jgi:hypothetical protein
MENAARFKLEISFKERHSTGPPDGQAERRSLSPDQGCLTQ